MFGAVSGATTWAMGAVVGGRYRLEGLLGAGGFGAVFRATSIHERREVAVKLLSRAAMVRESGIQRFQREAELAMRLKHESTIRVLDSGDAGDGTPFIAFELLEGRSLDVVLVREGKRTEGQALSIARALLGSLEEAHALGIVHRDVKPPNVYLAERPTRGVKLLDFGVAKSTAPSESAGLTQEGSMVGTPAYMAPEQIGGGDIGPSTDLYAVALVLSEMLTGVPVYRVAPLAICLEKMRGAPIPYSDELRASPLFPVIERAARHHPSARFASAREMLDALLALGIEEQPFTDESASHASAPLVIPASSTTAIIEPTAFGATGTASTMPSVPHTSPSSPQVFSASSVPDIVVRPPAPIGVGGTQPIRRPDAPTLPSATPGHRSVQPLVPTIPAPPLRGRRFWIGVVLALVATFVAAFAAAAFFQRRRQKRKRRSDARDEAEP